ncbi:MAG TPA: hypothetical protein VN323_13495 [Candidatus Dormibacteraeota bacterium]|nr:hypothetical protein [Candidatus Dormibacteraeota bacterium]
MTTRFPHHELRGSHREVCRQHGEALRPMIRAHLDLIYTQGSLRSQLAPEAARRGALAFGRTIGDAAPHFLEEIEGVAAGAGIEPVDHLRPRRGADGGRGGAALRARVRDLRGDPIAPAQLWRLDAAAAIETSAPMPTPIDPR